MNQSINRIKMLFLAATSIVVILLFSAIVGFHKNPYFTGTYIKSYMTNWKYKFEYARIYGATYGSSLFNGKDNYTASSTSKNAASIPVLVYHGVLPKSDGSEYNLSIDDFKNQMFALKAAGYRTISMHDLLRYMRGEIILPEKSFVLTFDDGRRDTYYNGDPILKTVGFNATMFVITRFSLEQDGSSYYLSTEELKQMENTGRWDLQAHTYNGHGLVTIDPMGDKAPFFGNKLWLVGQNRLETDKEYAERISEDLAKAKMQLENSMHKKVIAFAFPFGDHGQENTNYPKSNDVLVDHASSLFPLLFYQFGGGVRFSENYFNPEITENNAFMLRRMDIHPDWSGKDIVEALRDTGAKPLPYTDDLTDNNGWIESWGNIFIDNSGLSITPTVTDAGAATVLDGTGGWRDYSLTVTLNSENGNGAYMWVRFQDDNNTAACNFGNGFAHVEQIVHGTNRVIQGSTGSHIVIPQGDFTITARVQGRRLECILNNSITVSTNFLDPRLNQGGIGFKTWNHGNSGNSLTIKNVEVESLETSSPAASSVTE